MAQAVDWSSRFQELLDETGQRSMASMANVQRLLLAVGRAQLTPQALAAALPRFGEERGPEVYDRLTRLVSAFVAAVSEVGARCTEAYLGDLVADDARRNLGPRPSSPPPPEDASPAEWGAWYALFTARAADQQAWLARMYGLMLDEVAEGRLPRDEVQVATDAFLRDRAPEYLAAIAELGSDFLGAAMEIADDALDDLFGVLLDEPGPDGGAADELVLDVVGPPGGVARRSLAVESTLAVPTTVTCTATPAPGAGLAADPAEFALGPGGSRAVTIAVTLPADGPDGPFEAGVVVVRGQGERDLVVRVNAAAAAPGAAAPGG